MRILIVLFLLIATTARAQTDSTTRPAEDEHKPKGTQHSIKLSLGVTVESMSSADGETFTADWLSGLQAKYFSEGEPYQLGMSVYAKYGQLHSNEAPPHKTQDDLIVSVTPSITVVPPIGLRLFLEVTGETQMALGLVDDSVPTKFLDPLFLYQSLFLGKRLSSAADDGSWQFDLTAGIGYALQQTIAQNFILPQNRIKVTDQSPLSSVQDQVTIESGYSAIVDLDFQEDLSRGLMFSTSFKTVALTKENVHPHFQNARVTSLLLVGFQYKFLALDYSGHLVYDPNISLRRELEQSLVFGLKLTL